MALIISPHSWVRVVPRNTQWPEVGGSECCLVVVDFSEILSFPPLPSVLESEALPALKLQD